MSKLNRSAIKARNNLLGLFIVLTVLDIILVAVSRDMWAIGRIVVTIAVMYFVLQGYQWAKWVLIAILSLVAVLLTALIVALHSQLSSFLIIGSLIMIMLSVITISFLIYSSDLKQYFSDKRKVSFNGN
ncbi:MAG: hypothetical protein AAF298_21960 [Cyanobacteria bacterium P01_A01_bin.40]